MNSLQDVGDLFRTGQIELYFSKIVEALYDGKRFVSQDEVLNKVGLVKIQLVTQNLELLYPDRIPDKSCYSVRLHYFLNRL